MSHNYFTSLSISPNRNWLIISILILILYEHLISFTQSLRFLCINASLRNAELVRKEEALYLCFFTQELKMRKFVISCREWNHYVRHFFRLRCEKPSGSVELGYTRSKCWMANDGFIFSIRQDDPRCPIDGGSISGKQSFRVKCCEREVLNLQCFCRFNNKGCEWKGELRHLKVICVIFVGTLIDLPK